MDEHRTRDDHFPLFDSLRGLAALTVFTIHGIYQVAVNRPEEHWWYRYMLHFDVAVPIFFAISGFLLYRPFLAATIAGRGFSVKAYAWRRFLRIVPAYWVALPIIVFWFDLHEVKSLTGWLRFGGFAQIYDTDTALKGVGQAWTLDVEVTYYLFLPLFAVWLYKARTIRGALYAVLAMSAFGVLWKLLALTVTDAQHQGSNLWLYPLPAQLDHLGMGMLLAVLSVGAARTGDENVKGLAGQALRLVIARPAIAWVIAFAAWLLDAVLTDSGAHSGNTISDPQYMIKRELYAVFIFFLLVPAVFGDRSGIGLVRRLLAWRPLAYVGMISYSFYLYHFAVIAQMEKWWGRFPVGTEWLLWAAEGLAGTILLGSLGFYLVEKPAMSLKRLVPAGPKARQVEAAQASAAP